MNTTLSPVQLHSTTHPPQPVDTALDYEPRRVGLIDRLALHVGVALITWGRRPHGESRERRANRVEQQLARLERERVAERTLRLLEPLR
ncbi:MAG TPA: hypothetical protein VN200_01585 [Rhodoglobus sp.]|nr:hypothetical protein [Rhodoglobus sp.]